ncbi:MAG: transglutaminase family protein [Rhodoferax sp.]
MLLRVAHETCYHYGSPVVMAQHLAHLQPVDRPGLHVVTHSLHIDPQPPQLRSAPDAFGNVRCHFALATPHEVLTVYADMTVQTEPPQPVPAGTPWESVVEAFRYRVGVAYNPASEFLFASPYVARHRELADFARPLFEPGRPVLEAAGALMHHIHTEMRYASGSTGVNTPVLEALAQRKGVCQDFAHLMIGCLRSLGLPARYVSGYLLTRPPPGKPRLIGADASHAWVQAFDPDVGWVDFDPTNDAQGLGRPGESHVTLAIGRDFGDVSPLRGVIHGGANPTLSVAVTVAPPDEFDRMLAAAAAKNPG